LPEGYKYISSWDMLNGSRKMSMRKIYRLQTIDYSREPFDAFEVIMHISAPMLKYLDNFDDVTSF
jgi:hypothetical protein